MRHGSKLAAAVMVIGIFVALAGAALAPSDARAPSADEMENALGLLGPGIVDEPGNELDQLGRSGSLAAFLMTSTVGDGR
jgi:hypothetical protein